MLKGIIFDFDGVIADSVQIKTDAFGYLYNSYGKHIVNKVIQHHEANGGMSRFEKIRLYNEVFLNKPITDDEIIKLADQFSSFVKEKVIDAPYVGGALDYIKKCYKQYKLFISTGTPTDEMLEILKGRNIIGYFTNVFGSPEKKEEHISKIMTKYNIKKHELIFYGDSITDLEAAKKYKIPFILRKTAINDSLIKNYKGKIISNFYEL